MEENQAVFFVLFGICFLSAIFKQGQVGLVLVGNNTDTWTTKIDPG